MGIHDLEIPFCAVVDKDFFTPYKNGRLDASRAIETFLPEYSGEVSRNKVIEFLFNTDAKKNELKTYLGKSYSQFFEFVKEYGLLSMQYCLEMDLIANDKTKEVYFDNYGLQGAARTNKSLLIDRKKDIKDPTKLMPVVEAVAPRDYPISFKKIRHVLLEIIQEL